jgi:proton glutamate symport protein
MKLSLTARIFLGMLVGVGVGLALMLGNVPQDSVAPQLIKLTGDVFLNLLKMVIVPLILASMVTGVTSTGSASNLGRIGKQTFGFYLMTVLIAVTIGLILVNVLQPGVPLRQQTASAIAPTEDAAGAVQKAGERPTPYDLIRRIVPENPFRSMAEMDVLGVIFFALMLGFALMLMSLGPVRAGPMIRFFE